VRWRRLAIGALAVVALAWPAAAGDEPRRITLEILVAHISDQPGGIDPRGAALHRTLADQFRYETLRVLDRRHLDLPLGTVESVELPNGRRLNVRAFQLSSKGVLLGVTVTGSLQTDLRIPNGHLVVIGAERFEDGKLVISLEPSW
jgi:hypothetical protein